jgi:hypothetical protein
LYNYYSKLYSVDKCYIFSRTCKKPTFFGHYASKNLPPPRLNLQNSKYEFFKVTRKNFRKKMCFDFFESRLKIKLKKHWRESWLRSTRYFEFLVVKLTQTLFLNIIFRKILRKKSKKRKILENFFVVIWVVLCVQNINNRFGAFLWHNNCRKCRNRDTVSWIPFKLSFLFENNIF